MENNPKNELSQQELDLLGSRGYTVLEKIGEGQTRDVYLVQYKQGRVNKLRVMKASKLETDPTSICTTINKRKRDLDLAEVQTSNSIQHPNISETVDNVSTNIRTFNFETYHGG